MTNPRRSDGDIVIVGGYGQITGLVAAEIGRRLLAREEAPGVRHIEEFVRLAELLPALRRGHPALEVALPEHQ